MANKQRAAKPAQNDSSLPGTAAGTGPDAGTEASTGTGPDAATEASTDTGAAAGAGTEGGTSTGADAGTGPDAGLGTEGGTSTSAGAGTGPDAATGTEASTGTGSEDAAPSVDGRVRVRLLCTNHLGQIGDIVTVPTGHVEALRSGGLADPHPAALEAGE